MTDRKDTIIKKVRELYHRYGIRSVTMDDVVREVGISKKTLYQHFKDKNELVSAVIKCDSETKMEEHDDMIKNSANAIEMMLAFYSFQVKMIKEYKPTLIFDLKKYYPRVHNDFVENKRKIIYQNVLTNLVRGKKEGLYRKNLNEEVIAMLNLLRVEAFVNSATLNAEEILTPAFFKEMFTYHMYGIVSDEGRKILEENNCK